MGSKPNAGITAPDTVQLRDRAGLSPAAALPECPIVHPAICGYPCPDLCGAAVAFKLAQALGAPTADEELEPYPTATPSALCPTEIGGSGFPVRRSIGVTVPSLEFATHTSRPPTAMLGNPRASSLRRTSTFAIRDFQ